jgi:hypothetical protein
MAHTLIAVAPLLACPLGMALMAGVPALVHRTRRRRQTIELAERTDGVREPASRAA